MRASQELRWKQRIKENEDRRRRYEDASKRLEQEEKDKAQRALEERRAERARMDDLMRNPSQAPAPPKKPILRKGTGAVLRSPARTSPSHRPNTVPAQTTAATAAAGARSPGTAPVRAATAAGDRQRHEWAQGLKQFINCQREAAKPAVAQAVAPAAAAEAALSWRELKLAAEAGFEELLRMQEAAAAAAAGQQGSPAWRRPGMTRVLGGGGSTAEQGQGLLQLDWPIQGVVSTQQQVAAAAGSYTAAERGNSNRSPLMSKWGPTLQWDKGTTDADSCRSPQHPHAHSSLPATAEAAPCSKDFAGPQQEGPRVQPAQLDTEQPHQQGHGAVQPQGPQLKQQRLAAEPALPGEVSTERGEEGAAGLLQGCTGHTHGAAAAAQDLCASNKQQEASPAAGKRDLQQQLQHSSKDVPPGDTSSTAAGVGSGSCTGNVNSCAGGPSSCEQQQQAGDEQHLTAAHAAASLRASMEQLHRSSELARASSCSPAQCIGDGSSAEPQAEAADSTAAACPAGSTQQHCNAAGLSCSNSGSSAYAAEPDMHTDAAQQDAAAAVPADALAEDTSSAGIQAVGVLEATAAADVACNEPHPALEAVTATLQQLVKQEQQVMQLQDTEQQQEPADTQQQQQQMCIGHGQQAVEGATAAADAKPVPALDAVSIGAGATTAADAAANETATPATADDATGICPADADAAKQGSPVAPAGGSPTAAADPSTTLDALLAEARQLAALRRAVGAEFAAMGRSSVAAAMGAYEAGPLEGCTVGSSEKASLASGATDRSSATMQLPQQLQGVAATAVASVLEAPPLPEAAVQACSSAAAVGDQADNIQTGGCVSVQHHDMPETPQDTTGPVQDPCKEVPQQPMPLAHRQQPKQQQQQLMPQLQVHEVWQQPREQKKPKEQVPPSQSQRQQVLGPQPRGVEPEQQQQQQQQQQPWSRAASSQLLSPLQQSPSPSPPAILTCNPLYQSSPPSPAPEGRQPSAEQQEAVYATPLLPQHHPQQQMQFQHEPEHQQRAELEQGLDGWDWQMAGAPPSMTQGGFADLHRGMADSPWWQQEQQHQQQPEGLGVQGGCSVAAGQRPGAAPAVCAPSPTAATQHAHWPNSCDSPATQQQQQQQQQQPHVDWQRQAAAQAHPYSLQQLQAAYAAAQQAALAAAAGIPNLAQLQGCEAAAALHSGPYHGTCQFDAPCGDTSGGHQAGGAGGTTASNSSSGGGGGSSCDSSPPGGSRFLSKLASKARSAVRSAVGRIAAAGPTQQQQPQVTNRGAAAGHSLSPTPSKPTGMPATEQGSYVAAAALAQQRAQAQAADRERIAAAAEAAKQAAARQLAAERAEAQRRAAEQAAEHRAPPVAIGSYAQQQVQQQRTQQQRLQPEEPWQSAPQQQTDFGVCDVQQQLDSQQAYHLPAANSTTSRPVVDVNKQSQQTSSSRQPMQPHAPSSSSASSSSSSPRRKVFSQGASKQPAAATAVVRAADQCLPVSRIPSAPGTSPSSRCSTAPTSAAAAAEVTAKHCPAAPVAASAHQSLRQQQQQQDAAAVTDCSAGDDDFAFLERELLPANDARACADNLQQLPGTQGVLQGYRAQQQQQQHQQVVSQQQQQQVALQQQQVALQQSMQQQQQQQQQISRLTHQKLPAVERLPATTTLAAARRPPDDAVSRQPGMWAAVQAAAAGAAARGMQPATSLADGQRLPSAAPGQATLRQPSPTSRATGATSTAASNQKRAPTAAPQQQLWQQQQQQKPQQQHHLQQQQQQQQHPGVSRLSLEEASLLAELQQLDQRMHHTAEQRDALPSPSKLPGGSVGAGVGSPSKGRNAAGARPLAAPMATAVTPTLRRTRPADTSSAVPKLAAVRGAVGGRSSSTSSSDRSGRDVASKTPGRQQQLQKAAAKQSKLIGLPRSAGMTQDTQAAHRTPGGGPASAAGALHGLQGLPPGPAAAAPGGQLPPYYQWPDPCMGFMLGGSAPGSNAGLPLGAPGCWMPPYGMMGPGSVLPPGVGQQEVGWGPQVHAAHTAVGGAPWPLSQSPAGTWPQPPQQQQQQQQVWMGQVPSHSQPQHAEQQQQQQWQQQQLAAAAAGLFAAGFGPMAYTATGYAGMPQFQRPGASELALLQGFSPLTAPPSASVPSSPLLPTGHYHQTVMRNRTSGSGSSSAQQVSEGRWGSAGSSGGQGGGAPPTATWASRVSREAADVWPPRGLERSILSDARGRKEGGGGDIVVYNAHLLAP